MRELLWMAEAKRREQWAHTVTAVRWTVAAFSGKAVPASDIAPAGVFDEARRRVLTPEEQDAKDRHSFDSFLTAFGTIYGKR